MSKIRKTWGLISVIALFSGMALGLVTKGKESEITPTKTASQEKSHVASLGAETGIEIEQPEYISPEDLLRIDENALIFASYEDLEILEMGEYMMVGCGGIF